MIRNLSPFLLLLALLLSPGCMKLTTESEVKPIHITIDLNIRIQNELDNFFGDLDEANPALKNEKK